MIKQTSEHVTVLTAFDAKIEVCTSIPMEKEVLSENRHCVL